MDIDMPGLDDLIGLAAEHLVRRNIPVEAVELEYSAPHDSRVLEVEDYEKLNNLPG